MSDHSGCSSSKRICGDGQVGGKWRYGRNGRKCNGRDCRDGRYLWQRRYCWYWHRGRCQVSNVFDCRYDWRRYRVYQVIDCGWHNAWHESWHNTRYNTRYHAWRRRVNSGDSHGRGGRFSLRPCFLAHWISTSVHGCDDFHTDGQDFGSSTSLSAVVKSMVPGHGKSAPFPLFLRW